MDLLTKSTNLYLFIKSSVPPKGCRVAVITQAPFARGGEQSVPWTLLTQAPNPHLLSAPWYPSIPRRLTSLTVRSVLTVVALLCTGGHSAVGHGSHQS